MRTLVHLSHNRTPTRQDGVKWSRLPSPRHEEKEQRPRRGQHSGPGDDVARDSRSELLRSPHGKRPCITSARRPNDTITEYNKLDDLRDGDTSSPTAAPPSALSTELEIERNRNKPRRTAQAVPSGHHQRHPQVPADRYERRHRPAVNILVRDVLPAGARFIAAVDTVPVPDAFNCRYAAGNIDCTDGTLDGTLDMSRTSHRPDAGRSR